MAMTDAQAKLNATLAFTESLIVEARGALAAAHNQCGLDNGPGTLRELKRVKLLVSHAVLLLSDQDVPPPARELWRRLLG